ncbi:nitroreductase family protein [Oscillibacter sp. MSJ-2]|uniref:Nitroreductase family protein n=1 Tax=Dysosmobacter acutus TaxID=2841504 RepID=A0ABS6FCN6_9FIRM|nr:nitroreductase family protein [Dysosmobacter acutus]MBU5628058.1 nitroreductase family protein [Dysosmobacter acutus]
MEFAELVKERYSLRKFSSRPVEQEKLDLLLEAAQASPTAKNLQPQRIFVLRSRSAIEKVNQCTPCHFGAPVILAVGYDASAAWVRSDGKNHGEIDAAITTAHIMLQAAALGLGTTYVGMFDPVELERELPQLQGVKVIALLPVGYAAEGAHPAHLHSQRNPLEDMVTYL